MHVDDELSWLEDVFFPALMWRTRKLDCVLDELNDINALKKRVLLRSIGNFSYVLCFSMARCINSRHDLGHSWNYLSLNSSSSSCNVPNRDFNPFDLHPIEVTVPIGAPISQSTKFLQLDHLCADTKAKIAKQIRENVEQRDASESFVVNGVAFVLHKGETFEEVLVERDLKWRETDAQ